MYSGQVYKLMLTGACVFGSAWTVIKDIPGCLFTRTSLLNSSSNLEQICKCEYQMFLTRDNKDYISNKNIYFMKEIYYKCEPQNLESNHFPIPLY